MSARARGVPVRPPLLSHDHRLAIYAVGVGVWLTGALWVIAHYFLVQEGDFGTEIHPLEFWSLAIHGAFAFAATWAFGLLWGVHIVAGWRSHRRRWTGGFMFGLIAWLTITGYALYYLGNDDAITLVMLFHWTIGLAAPIFFLLHRFMRQQ